MELLCQAPLLPPITRNTSIVEAITPCNASVFTLFPTTLALISTLFLFLYGRLFPATCLSLSTNIIRIKLGLFGVWFICLLLIGALNVFLGLSSVQFREHFLLAISSTLFIILFCLSYDLCIWNGIVSSAFLHITSLWWLICTLPLVVFSGNQIFNIGNYETITALNFIFYSLNTVFSIATLIVFCYPDIDVTRNYRRLDDKPICPFTECSAIQNILFSYSGPLLKKSFSHPLTIAEDYWGLEKRSRASNIVQKVTLSRNATLWQLFFILCKTSGPQLSMSAFGAVSNVLLRLGYCLFLKWSLETASGDYPFWLVILNSVCIVVCDVTRNVTYTQSCLSGYQAYLNIRGALMTMVFDKMMRLSAKEQCETPIGVISNHISVDIQHNKQFWYDLQFVIYSPFMISSSLYFLSKEVGFRNTYTGFIVLLGFMIFNLVMARIYKKFEVSQMRFKDERLKLVNDVFNGIKVIKFYGWEESVQKLLSKIRKQELKWLRNAYFIDNIIGCTFNFGPLLATITTFYGYVIVDKNQLTPDVAFITLLLFAVTRFAIYKLPLIFTNAVMAFVSLKRLLAFFNKEDRPVSCVVERKDDDPIVVDFKNATFSWSDSIERPTLQDINLQIKSGQLIGVLGRVGSGKSTLLQALAGELGPIEGECLVRANSLAYLPQLPWILNKTLRDNVLFDQEENVDYEFYGQTLSACALSEDLKLLPASDLTEIGEKGINLSGGQKARVAMARSVFRRADLYIVDDSFSALDMHVGMHVFQEVFGPNGLLKDTTRIIALNSTYFLPFFDSIIYLEDGQIKHVGSYESIEHLLTTSSSAFQTPLKVNERVEETKFVLKDDEDGEIDFLVEAERLHTGRRSLSLFYTYIESFGLQLFTLYIFLLAVCSATLVAISNLYIAQWVSDESSHGEKLLEKLEIYAICGIGSTLFVGTSYALQTYGSFKAAQRIHDNVVSNVLRAPMAFFDRTPIGRILNRLSSDIERVDTGISRSYGFFFILISEVTQCLIAMFVAIPWLMIVISPLIVVFTFAVRYFNRASIQFRRITSNSMSAVFSAVSDSYVGASSIRVFGCLDRFRSDFHSKLDLNTESQLVEVLTSYFMQIRLDLFTDIIVLIFLIIAVILTSIEWLKIGLFALVINNCIILCGFFGEVADVYRVAETELIAVERLDEYTKLEQEPIWQSNNKPNVFPNSWSIEFDNVSLRYKENNDPVLHNVSFKIESGERVGVVGRTGAGKTSLTSLLFRLVEPFEGNILIGGVDIKELGHDLRKMLTIIPQDPILFAGTLRSNLDPFEEFGDAVVLEALQNAHLINFFSNTPNPLEFCVNDGGSNLSVGERQLVCLARALLRRSKILVLDEASASVDLHTDELIQQTIREQFAQSTILTIAHRIDTIANYDRIIEMESGRVKLFDKPDIVLANRFTC